LKLKPVTYNYNVNEIDNFLGVPDSLRIETNKNSIIYSGFIAQDVENSAKDLNYNFSGVDTPDNENDYYGLRYAEFVVPIVKAIQEQQLLIEIQRREIELLKQEIKQMKVD
jgi:hypothetical protein